MNDRHGQTARKIPVAPHAVPEVLVRLKQDTADDRLRWRLGDHGACEIAPPREAPERVDPTLLVQTTGRLIAPDGVSACRVSIALHSFDDRSCELLLDAVGHDGTWFGDEPAAFAALRRAALRELAEDLRFHASRAAASVRAA